MNTLVDAAARERIRTETESNLFVEAGAGSGKTESLVDRVTTLVLGDGLPLRNIAAVTFTEKAGAELRDRLRANFEKKWRDARNPEQERARAAEALDDLDSAAIGTLHSFAQRILTMHPIEAGLPPLIEVLDEVASSVAFEERWSVLQRALLDDPEMADRLLLAMSAGVKLDHIRSVTRAFGADWDLIDSHVLAAGSPDAKPPDVVGLADQAARLSARASECRDSADKFLPDLAGLGDWGANLASSSHARERYAALLSADELKFRWGKKDSWTDLDGLKNECRDLQELAAQAGAAYTEATLRPLAYWIAERVRHAAVDRASQGKLEFHDLLVLARGLLRDNEDVRAAMQKQFPRLLLDEFQDTDPIQIELAVRIAGGREASAPDWSDVVVPPGSLFVVGDPKQSIYRFRRANIGIYLHAQTWMDQTVRLTTNFRTVGPVLDWVNTVFAEVIQQVSDAQPGYEPLATHRTEPAEGPAVLVLGRDEHPFKGWGNASLLRSLEAEDVARSVTKALAEKWTIQDPHTKQWRTIRRRDIAILIPARTSLDVLETALDDAGIPYRAESSSLVYQAQEVRDLMAAARVVADPSDQFACVTTLRSPLFGCGDDDLWTWKRARGSFNILAPVDESLRDHPVGRAVAYLRRLHHQSRWMTPSEVLGGLVADRRMLEVAADGSRSRDQWRRLRFVVDQARAWSEVEHGGLRSYLVWAAKQSEESSRVAEAVLPETDVDAVRIMTVHGAKGLEFPMVVLSGMTSAPRNPSGVQLLWKPDGYAIKLTKTVQTNDFKDVQPIDEQMDAYERRRLLYVATTRARDHLVVSLHRGSGTTLSNARLLADARAGTAIGATELAATDDADHRSSMSRHSGSIPPPPDLIAWRHRIEAVRQGTRHIPAQSASGLEGTEPEVVLERDDLEVPGLAKGARDVELPPWSKGRYGSEIGRAVHAVLQVVDLASGSGAEESVAAQCLAEGVLGQEDLVRSLVQSALSSDLVQRAAAREHWRETYVGTVQDDGTVLEGFVDLIYREDDGALVVVDYKTDAVPAGAIPSRVTYYAPQMNAYRECLADGTGSTVISVLLFLHPDSSTAVPVTMNA